MSDSSALDSFLDKWRHRWPEWQMAEPFVTPERRGLAEAWFALLQEFDDILNIAGDPLPANAKLAWWSEELHGWTTQRSRHPLGRRLQPIPAPWSVLAQALPSLIDARTAVDDTASFAQLRNYAEAVAAVETVLLGHPPHAQAMLARILATRLAESGPAALPQNRSGADDALRTWATVLQQAWSPARSGARERRIIDAFARARLRRFAVGGQMAALPSRLHLLLTAWWAARGR